MTTGVGTEYFRNHEEALLAQARAAGLLKSSTSKGRSLEGLLSAILKDHLPERLSVRAGEVFDSAGRRSGECDLVLVDHNVRVHRIGGEDAAPAEAAVGVIEVKAGLTKKELEKAIRKIASVKSLERTTHHGLYSTSSDAPARVPLPPRSPHGYILAFGGLSWSKIREHLEANPSWYGSDYMLYGPEIIGVLVQGILYKNDMTIYRPSPQFENLTAVTVEVVSALGEIVHHLQETVNRYGQLTYELGPYL